MWDLTGVVVFQPTLPVRGATSRSLKDILKSLSFQPTLPVRGATPVTDQDWFTRYISTHAPRAGSDRRPCRRSNWRSDFNPRSPCGERRQKDTPIPPAAPISTHAPRAGSDPSPVSSHVRLIPFQPTLPVRGATRHIMRDGTRQNISTHAPRAGSDTRTYQGYY